MDFTNEELRMALINKDPVLYALRKRRIKGTPITFFSNRSPQKHRPWQIDILRDQHPNKVIRKSRQLGLSEMGITETIWFLDTHPNTKAMYTFPRKEQMEDFSNTRIAPIFEESDYMRSRLDPKMNNVRLKKIGTSQLFLRSAWGGALGEGVDIDVLGLDEYDRMKDGVELAFRESMKSSEYHLMRRWSTPTIPGRGVDKLFTEDSDQRFYHHKCNHCGKWQILTFEDSIKQVDPDGVDRVTEQIKDGTFKFVCKFCHKELDRWGKGQYVAKYPSRHEIRGYHISQLDAVWISADEIMRNQFQYPVKQLFYNYVIGMPYASEGLLITDEDVYNCIGFNDPIGYRKEGVYKKIVAGIDWGYYNWMVVLGLREDNQIDLLNLYWAEDNGRKPLDSVSEFAALLKPFNPDVIVADNGYGADRNSYMLQIFPGRVYACDWDTPRTSIPLVDSWQDKSQRVRVDKTVKMKRTLYNIKGGALHIFNRNEKMDMLIKHLKNVRTLLEEDQGEIYERVTRIGPDHLACALTYSYIALDRILGLDKPKTRLDYDFM